MLQQSAVHCSCEKKDVIAIIFPLYLLCALSVLFRLAAERKDPLPCRRTIAHSGSGTEERRVVHYDAVFEEVSPSDALFRP